MSLSFTSGLATPGREPCRTTVDGGLWPLLVVRLGRDATMQELEAYLAEREAWLRRCEPHLCLFDARAVNLPAAPLRQRYTEWLCEHEAELRQWVLGNAYIIQSPEVRMMMSVIRHFGRITTPFVVTPTLPPAAAWAAERLQDAGLVPAATRVRAQYAIAAS